MFLASFYKQLSLAFVATALATGARPQSSFAGWYVSSNRVALHGNFTLIADITLRTTDQWMHRQTLMMRMGLQYRFNTHWSIAAGYSFVNSRQTSDEYFSYSIEHQFFEQALWSHRLPIGKGIYVKPGNVSHRIRIEERLVPEVLLQATTLKTTGTHYATRFRYLVRDITPFRSAPVFEKGSYLALQNELMLNLSGGRHLNGYVFDQNRCYLAYGYRFSKKLDLELGYMHRFIKPDEPPTLHDHVLQLMSWVRL